MSVGCRRNAVVIGSLSLLCSLVFAGWTAQTSGVTADLYSVHFPVNVDTGYAVGATGTILKTTDGGGTWVAESSHTGNALNSVYFVNNSTGYAVGGRGTALKTVDGGATWTTMTVPGTDQLRYVSFPENGQTGYIGVNTLGGTGKVLKTTDGGSNWATVAVGGAMNTSYSCGMATDNAGVAFGAGGFIVGTTDGFGTTAYQGPLTTADLVAAAFCPADPLKGYLIANDSMQGIVRHTATGGTPLWDSVRCYPITAYYGVDVPATDAAYICGTDGRIDRSVSPTDFFRTTTGVTVTMYGLCFPTHADTGYAVGAAGTILRTDNAGIPWLPGVAEGKVPTVSRTAVRVVSNPSRHGIALHSDAAVRVSVFDAAGRVVVSQAATKGLTFLPLPTGAYFVKAGAATARVVVTD